MVSGLSRFVVSGLVVFDWVGLRSSRFRVWFKYFRVIQLVLRFDFGLLGASFGLFGFDLW